MAASEAARTRRTRTAARGALMVGAVWLLIGAGSAGAADGVVVPLDTLTTGPAGSVVQLAVVAVDPSLVGRSCTAVYEADNNSSVHPGTDLLLSSGDRQSVLSDVEATPGAVTSGSSELLLGTSLTVAVRLGSDGMASLGASLSISCPDAVVTVTTSVPADTTSTTPSSTTAPAPTTTVVLDTTTTAVAAAGPVSTAVPTTTPAPTTPAPTAPAPTITAPAPPQLPATGSELGWFVFVGASVMAAGALTRRVAKPDR